MRLFMIVTGFPQVVEIKTFWSFEAAVFRSKAQINGRLPITQIEHGHHFAIFLADSPGQDTEATECETSHRRERQQDAYHDKSIDDQIPDIIAAGGYVLVPGD